MLIIETVKMKMRVAVSVVMCLLSIQMYQCAPMKDDDMKMDQIIMRSAKSLKMFDLSHIMDGELMIMTELDILMSLSEFAHYKRANHRSKRKAVSNEEKHWENSRVYYDFARDVFSDEDKRVIRQAIAEWENFTCLNFTRSSEEPNRIEFRDGDGCYSRLGRVGGVQPIALGSGCRRKGVVIHEIGHAIGWIHEQSRPDRDDFITVNYRNIPLDWHPQFDKETEEFIDDHDVQYDYESIMHYSGNAFGNETIITHDPAAQNKIGQRTGLSFRDIKLANLMYRCAERVKCPLRSCPGEGFMGKHCKCVCPGPLGNPLVPCSVKPYPTSAPTTTALSLTTTTTGRPVNPGPDCMDLREDCQSLNKGGSCKNDIARMSIFCRKTCGLCSKERACMDYGPGCELFQASGYCELDGFRRIIELQCPLSCGKCQPVDNCDIARDVPSNSPQMQMPLVQTITIIVMLMGIV